MVLERLLKVLRTWCEESNGCCYCRGSLGLPSVVTKEAGSQAAAVCGLKVCGGLRGCCWILALEILSLDSSRDA